MADKTKENEVREVLVKLKYIEGQMAGAQNQMAALERGLMEITTSKVALGSVKELKKDSNSLLPLGSGIFAKGTLLKQDTVLVDVGAGAIVEKQVSDVEKLLVEREKEIQTSMSNFQQILLSLEKEYNALAEKARALTG